MNPRLGWTIWRRFRALAPRRQAAVAVGLVVLVSAPVWLGGSTEAEEVETVSRIVRVERPASTATGDEAMGSSDSNGADPEPAAPDESAAIPRDAPAPDPTAGVADRDGAGSASPGAATGDSGSAGGVVVVPRSGIVAAESLSGQALLESIATLTIAPQTSTPRYDRKRFREGIDADGNACRTRCEVLTRQLDGGRWFSPYDGVWANHPDELEMDHVVALAEAWRSGASGWTDARREAFANDLDERRALIMVTSRSNQQKSDKDPAGWLPRRADECRYVDAWVAVKRKWGLSADAEEMSALTDVALRCGATNPHGGAVQAPAPTAAPAATAAPAPAPTPAPAPLVAPVPLVPQTAPPTSRPAEVTAAPPAPSGGASGGGSGGASGGGSVTYQNCTDVWNRIGRSILRGDPGYASKLDRDGDGFGCENDPR